MYIIQSGSHRDLRDVGVRVKAKSLWGVNHWQVGNEGEVLIEFIAFWYRVALVEAEVVGEHVLAKPGATERVQQTLVIVIRHTAAILYLSKHVPNGTPTHTLQSTSDMFTHSESLHRHSNGGVTDRQTDLLGIHVVQVVLYKLDTSIEVRSIELVWYVPTQRSKLSSLLKCGENKY